MSPRVAGRSISRTGSCVSPMPQPIHRIRSSLICRLSRTRSGVGIGSGCRSLVAPIPATGATSAPQSRSPPAHAYRPATVQCSTMRSTLPQCGYPCAADHQCRLPPGLSALSVDLISRAAVHQVALSVPAASRGQQVASRRSRYDLATSMEFASSPGPETTRERPDSGATASYTWVTPAGSVGSVTGNG